MPFLAGGELPSQHRELALPPHQRRRGPRDARGAVAWNLEQSKGSDRLAFALDHETIERLGSNHVAHEPVCVASQEDLARLRRLLQAGRDVHRVAGDQPLAGDWVAGDHLTGVHPGAHLDPNPVVPRQLFVQGRQLLAHGVRRRHRSKRVVLVQLRDAEDRHHRVADELFHHAAVALDDAAHRVEISFHDSAQGLGIQALAERSRAGDVREDHGDRSSRLGALRHGPRAAACGTEAGVLRVLTSTVWARPHTSSVGGARQGIVGGPGFEPGTVGL